MYVDLNYILGEEFTNAVETEDAKQYVPKMLGLNTKLDSLSSLDCLDVMAAVYELYTMISGMNDIANMWKHKVSCLSFFAEENNESIIAERKAKQETIISTYDSHIRNLNLAYLILQKILSDILKM